MRKVFLSLFLTFSVLFSSFVPCFADTVDNSQYAALRTYITDGMTHIFDGGYSAALSNAQTFTNYVILDSMYDNEYNHNTLVYAWNSSNSNDRVELKSDGQVFFFFPSGGQYFVYDGYGNMTHQNDVSFAYTHTTYEDNWQNNSSFLIHYHLRSDFPIIDTNGVKVTPIDSSWTGYIGVDYPLGTSSFTLNRGYGANVKFKDGINYNSTSKIKVTSGQVYLNPTSSTYINNQSYSPSLMSNSFSSNFYSIPWINTSDLSKRGGSFSSALFDLKKQSNYSPSESNPLGYISFQNPTFYKYSVSDNGNIAGTDGDYPGFLNPYNDPLVITYDPDVFTISQYRLIENDGSVIGSTPTDLTNTQGAISSGAVPDTASTGGDSSGMNGSGGIGSPASNGSADGNIFTGLQHLFSDTLSGIRDAIIAIPTLIASVVSSISSAISTTVGSASGLIAQASSFFTFLSQLFTWLPTPISALITFGFGCFVIIAVIKFML